MARGHVRKRGASYQAIVYAGIDPVTKPQRYLRETALQFVRGVRWEPTVTAVNGTLVARPVRATWYTMAPLAPTLTVG